MAYPRQPIQIVKCPYAREELWASESSCQPQQLFTLKFPRL